MVCMRLTRLTYPRVLSVSIGAPPCIAFPESQATSPWQGRGVTKIPAFHPKTYDQTNTAAVH